MSAYLKAECTRLQTHQDRQREHEIESEYQAMKDCFEAGNRQQARYHKDKMEALIAERSPEQVLKMETERGLRG